MNKPVKHQNAANKLLEFLKGHYISKVIYYITGWELFVVIEDGSEIRISTAELRIPERQQWQTHLSSPPFNLQMGNEPGDTASAIALFNVLNSFSVTGVIIDNEGTLELSFSAGRTLIFPGRVDGVDWTWQVDRNGENLVTCDSGPLFGHPDFIACA